MTLTLQIALLIALHFVLPGVYILRLIRTEFLDKASWLNQILQGMALVGFVTLVGRWDWFSRYLRFLPLILMTLAVAVSLPKIIGKPNYRSELHKPWWRQGLRWLETGLVTAAVVVALTGLQVEPKAINLSFPLEDGEFQVAQGGGSILLNAHRPNQAQAYAVDIVELNSLGARAKGLYPNQVSAYKIYGEKVLSPCAGAVVKKQTGLPDLIPPERDTRNLAGNHLVIRCKGTDILLAHLQEGSIDVEKGQRVEAQEPLARVGNSGNTTEPHLHIHAVRQGSGSVMDGAPVPITFKGRFPVRNSIFAR